MPSAARNSRTFYAAYDAALRGANALDFDSLVFNAHQLFVRFAALARRYRSAYRYWCVDEFQDTNLAQYQLLKAMAGESFRNVFAVADDDQIIYQWNGADYRRIDRSARISTPRCCKSQRISVVPQKSWHARTNS